jgi:hypothetical protein
MVARVSNTWSVMLIIPWSFYHPPYIEVLWIHNTSGPPRTLIRFTRIQLVNFVPVLTWLSRDPLLSVRPRKFMLIYTLPNLLYVSRGTESISLHINLASSI